MGKTFYPGKITKVNLFSFFFICIISFNSLISFTMQEIFTTPIVEVRYMKLKEIKSKERKLLLKCFLLLKWFPEIYALTKEVAKCVSFHVNKSTSYVSLRRMIHEKNAPFLFLTLFITKTVTAYSVQAPLGIKAHNQGNVWVGVYYIAQLCL